MSDNSLRCFTCSMELTLDLIGGKWKPILIYHIGNTGKLRYGELKRLIPQISERVLSRELRELESSNIISRQEFKEKVLRVEYSLTPDGKDVLPILNALTQWGSNYNKNHNYASVECE
ncbi:MAG: helix-turn-helix domain-containing protein [Eubacteriales bacterium]